MWKRVRRPDRSEVCSWSPASRHYMHLWDQLIILQGVVFRKFDKRDKTDQYLQLLTPHSLRKGIVTEMHTCILSGHLGKRKTHTKVMQRYYWYNCREDINIFVTQCEICGAMKLYQKHQKHH